jgi:hypothetical protein
MYSIIAIHIMLLAFLARNTPQMPCDLLLSESEWETFTVRQTEPEQGLSIPCY